MKDSSNSSSFCQKYPSVLEGSDGTEGTSCPLTENSMLPVAYIPLLLYTWNVMMYTHHVNDMCDIIFAGAAVML
jgi:hypothetical protein